MRVDLSDILNLARQSFKKRNFTFLVLLFLCNALSFSQELSSSVSKSQVKIGEPVELKLKVKIEKNTSLSFEPFTNEIPAARRKKESQVNENKISVEITSDFKDTTINNGDKTTWIGNYSLVVWDTGKIVLPAQKILINDSTYFFNESIINVKSETIGIQDELFDIEEGFSDVPDKLSFLQLLIKYWYVTLGVLLLVIGLILFLIKKKKSTSIKLQKVMSLKDRTLFLINALDDRKLWLDDKLKEHYTELTHIMRSYLSSRYKLNLLERTTFETRALLLQQGLAKDTVETFMTILRQADMVKFANSTSDELNIKKISMLARQIVAETSPLEIENEEMI